MSTGIKTLRQLITLLPNNGASSVKKELMVLADEVDLLLEIEKKHVTLVANLHRLEEALKEREMLLRNTVPTEPVVVAVHNDFIKLVSTIADFIEKVTADATPKDNVLDALTIYNGLMERISQKPAN